MGLYADQLVPRLIHFAMRGEKFQDLRRGLVGRAKGRVLEIGIGSGLNLPFYGAEVENVTGIDPSETGLVLAERNAQSTRINVDLIQGGAERVPTSDAMYDTVVSTWTLCSVENVNEVFAEIHRVLKPGGHFLFLEHGLATDQGVARWQHRLTPLMRKVAGGCHLNRPLDKLIAASSLNIDHMETGYMLPGPRPFVNNFLGSAMRG
jgi:ubiquinone/menaquinone biosynthesis C-methylase UbiE